MMKLPERFFFKIFTKQPKTSQNLQFKSELIDKHILYFQSYSFWQKHSDLQKIADVLVILLLHIQKYISYLKKTHKNMCNLL